MTCTCGYMLQGCIRLNVYGHAPAHQTSFNPSSLTVSLRSAAQDEKHPRLHALQYNNALLMTYTIKLDDADSNDHTASV